MVLRYRCGYQLAMLMAIAGLSSCTSRIVAPRAFDGTRVSAEANYSQGVSESDLKDEAAISESCVRAWRRSLTGDTDGAIKQLKELERQYPKVSTVRFMIGQILDRAGRKKEAIEYYKDSVRQFEFSSIHLYKLAEAMRTTGDAKGSIVYYRKLVQSSPDFAPGKLGLSKALLQVDPNSAEAKEQIEEVLKADPDNKDALSILKDSNKPNGK